VRLASFWAGPLLSPAESAVEGRELKSVKNSAEFGGKVLLKIVFDKCRCFEKRLPRNFRCTAYFLAQGAP
jgi:hypothetical protein